MEDEMLIKVTVTAEIEDGTRAERVAQVDEGDSRVYVHSVELAGAAALSEVASMVAATHADKRGQLSSIITAVEIPGLPRKVHRMGR